MRNIIDSGNYKRSGMFGVNVEERRLRSWVGARLSLFFFFNALTKSLNIIQKAIEVEGF